LYVDHDPGPTENNFFPPLGYNTTNELEKRVTRIFDLGAFCPELLAELGATVEKHGANSETSILFLAYNARSNLPELLGELGAN
jgi:hypothetical protein